MPFSGTGPLWLRGSTAGVGAGNNALQPGTAEAVGNQGAANFGTSTTVRYIQLAPSGTSTATVTPAATDGIGWNMLLADSDATDNLPSERLLPAGNVVVTGVVNVGTVDATGTFAIQAILSVRDAAGSLTMLGSATHSGITTATTGRHSFSCSVAVSRTLIPAGSTLHLNLFIQGRGVAIVGQVFTLRRGTDTAPIASVNTAANLPSPGLGYSFPRTHSLVGAGAVAMQRSIVRTLTVIGAGVALLGVRGLARLLLVTGSGTASLKREVGKPFAVAGAGTVSMVRGVGIRKAVTGTGAAAMQRAVAVGKSVTGTGVAILARVVSASRVFSVTGVGVPGFARAIISARKFLVTGSGSVFARIGIPQSVLNRMTGGGGTTIIKKVVTYIFDD